MKNYIITHARTLATLFAKEFIRQLYSLSLQATRTCTKQLGILQECVDAISNSSSSPKQNTIASAQHAISTLISILKPCQTDLIQKFIELKA